MLSKFESFVGVNFWTMLFAWLNLLILYLFLKKLLFKPLKNMIDSRQKEIDDTYADADKSQKDAMALKAEYEEKIKCADEESERIIKDASRRAQLKSEDILKEAGEEARRTLERAKEQIELEKKQALSDIKNEVSSIAIGIAEAVIEKEVSEEEHRKMIDEFIENMGNEE